MKRYSKRAVEQQRVRAINKYLCLDKDISVIIYYVLIYHICHKNTHLVPEYICKYEYTYKYPCPQFIVWFVTDYR